MKENEVKHLKDQIKFLEKRVQELEQNKEILLENRDFHNQERSRLLTKLEQKETYLKFEQAGRQKAILNFVELLMEIYYESFLN